MIHIDINPVAFGSVRWYGILVALGIAVLVAWIAWHVRKENRISVDTVLIAAIVGIPSGVIFSRLVHVIDLWDYYSQNPGQIIGGEGLTIWGAIIGGTIGIWITSRFIKFNFGYFTDILAPGLILAQFIGRIGCTINGCCYGDECSLPWGIVYTNENSFGPIGVEVQPTTIYEMLFLAACFGLVLFLRNRIKPEGSLYMIYLSLYSIWRIVIGFIRPGTDFMFGLHEAQIIGIVVLLITIPLMIKNTRWGKPEINLPVADSGSDETVTDNPEETDTPPDEDHADDTPENKE